jgi:hypothetical protein
VAGSAGVLTLRIGLVHVQQTRPRSSGIHELNGGSCAERPHRLAVRSTLGRTKLLARTADYPNLKSPVIGGNAEEPSEFPQLPRRNSHSIVLRRL